MVFLQPEYFKFFFLLAAALPLWLYYFLAKKSARARLGTAGPLYAVSHLHSLWRDIARYLLVNLALAALVLALAHPQMKVEKPVPEPEKMDVVILLDTSPSMLAEDIPPSRLERALEIIGRFARTKPPQDRVGLVSFSSASLILSYLTEDPANILYYVDYLKDDSSFNPGTNIGRALRSGLEVFSREAGIHPGAARHKRVLILISDGEDHGDELDSALREVRRQGIRVHTIGVGSLEGAPIPLARENGARRYVEDSGGNKVLSRFDERALGRIAEVTGGSAHRSFTGQELDGFFQQIVGEERKIEGFKRVIEYRDAYRWFLMAGFSLLFIRLMI